LSYLQTPCDENSSNDAGHSLPPPSTSDSVIYSLFVPIGGGASKPGCVRSRSANLRVRCVTVSRQPLGATVLSYFVAFVGLTQY